MNTRSGRRRLFLEALEDRRLLSGLSLLSTPSLPSITVVDPAVGSVTGEVALVGDGPLTSSPTVETVLEPDVTELLVPVAGPVSGSDGLADVTGEGPSLPGDPVSLPVEDAGGTIIATTTDHPVEDGSALGAVADLVLTGPSDSLDVVGPVVEAVVTDVAGPVNTGLVVAGVADVVEPLGADVISTAAGLTSPVLDAVETAVGVVDTTVSLVVDGTDTLAVLAPVVDQLASGESANLTTGLLDLVGPTLATVTTTADTVVDGTTITAGPIQVGGSLDDGLVLAVPPVEVGLGDRGTSLDPSGVTIGLDDTGAGIVVSDTEIVLGGAELDLGDTTVGIIDVPSGPGDPGVAVDVGGLVNPPVMVPDEGGLIGDGVFGPTRPGDLGGIIGPVVGVVPPGSGPVMVGAAPVVSTGDVPLPATPGDSLTGAEAVVAADRGLFLVFSGSDGALTTLEYLGFGDGARLHAAAASLPANGAATTATSREELLPAAATTGQPSLLPGVEDVSDAGATVPTNTPVAALSSHETHTGTRLATSGDEGGDALESRPQPAPQFEAAAPAEVLARARSRVFSDARAEDRLSSRSGLLDTVVPSTDVSLDLALQQFLDQFERLARELALVLANTGLGPWLVAAAAAAAACEAVRRKRRKALDQAFVDGCPGLAGDVPPGLWVMD